MDTFVVRLYSERQTDRPDDACLRGVVEEISTGVRATFRGGEELLAILDRSGRGKSELSIPRTDSSGSIGRAH